MEKENTVTKITSSLFFGSTVGGGGVISNSHKPTRFRRGLCCGPCWPSIAYVLMRRDFEDMRHLPYAPRPPCFTINVPLPSSLFSYTFLPDEVYNKMPQGLDARGPMTKLLFCIYCLQKYYCTKLPPVYCKYLPAGDAELVVSACPEVRRIIIKGRHFASHTLGLPRGACVSEASSGSVGQGKNTSYRYNCMGCQKGMLLNSNLILLALEYMFSTKIHCMFSVVASGAIRVARPPPHPKTWV